jgi:hypothetical protein
MRTYGEVFFRIILIRQLIERGFRLEINIFEPSPSWPKFDIYNDAENHIWFEQVVELVNTFIEESDQISIRRFPVFSGNLPREGTLSSIERIFTQSTPILPFVVLIYLLRKLLGRPQPSLDFRCYALTEMEKSNGGLPDNFISWNVRRNQKYGAQRNPSDAKTIEDFERLCQVQPLPIVLLTEAQSRDDVKLLLIGDQRTRIFAHERLHVADSESFLEVLQTVWASKGYFQTLGGGAGVAAIFSEIPYYMSFPNRELTGGLHVNRRNRTTPWARDVPQWSGIEGDHEPNFAEIYRNHMELNGHVNH